MTPHTVHQLHAEDCDGSCTMKVDYGFRLLSLDGNPPAVSNHNTSPSPFFSSSSSYRHPDSHAYYHFNDDIAANIATHGSTMSSSAQHSGPLAELDEADINVISYTCVQLKEGDDIDSVAKSALTTALDNADYGWAGDKSTWGNEKGVGLLADIEEMKRRMAQLEGKDMITKREIAQLKREDTTKTREIAQLKMEDTIKGDRIEGLERRLATATSASEGYRKIRHRFLDVFVREHMGGATAEGREHIRQSNFAAHGADVIADAELYNSKERQDENVFIKIYGVGVNLTAQLVEDDDLRSIAVINAGASWRAQDPNEVPLDITACYEEFVDALGLSIGKSPRTTRFRKAYHEFWACVKRYKK